MNRRENGSGAGASAGTADVAPEDAGGREAGGGPEAAGGPDTAGSGASSAIQEVRVAQGGGDRILHDIRAFVPQVGIDRIATVKVYRFEGLTPEETELLAQRLLHSATDRVHALNRPLLTDASWTCEVAYKPGVMNPETASILKASRDLGLDQLQAVDTSIEYHFYGPVAEADRRLVLPLLVNETVQAVVTRKPATLRIGGKRGTTRPVPLRGLSAAELETLSARRQLFLDAAEMQAVQSFYDGLGREPTDAEIETLAQTWSEHCGHKTFRAEVVVNGQTKEPFIKRIKAAAARYSQEVVSSFVDNSGVLRFYEGWAVCGKVETHNSPSAIEPYGGAATGSGGVFRDIMGTGQGARTIASTDIFCFAPPELPFDSLPPGCLHPRYLLRRVVAGVRDYGNRVGIPTNNGSVHFHPAFRAKPVVMVGAYGLVPEKYARKGAPREGDRVLLVGGRTGRDGIHGATFSSGEMDSRTVSVNAAAVQIGNPIEEKRTLDALLEARDRGWIRAITDCGGGGLSSAVGEMGADTGVHVRLERVPQKYAGLAPWEIWLSESQERMLLAVDPDDVDDVIELCRSFNVEATDIGKFTGDRKLRLAYEDETVCDLPMEFVHDGIPQRRLVTEWSAPAAESSVPPAPTDWTRTCCAVLSHGNVCSKEPIVRQYDHTVQGALVLSPLGGVRDDGPNDAVVLRPLPDRPYGLVISHGLNPGLSLLDPYWGSIWSGVEALANLVAVGGDPREAALIDNFVWPYPDPESLGGLDRAVDACVDLMDAFRLPFISGKDSLSGTYRYPDGRVLKIPPTLCVSVFGRIEDVSRTVTADFKRAGSLIVLLGNLQPEALGGSTYFEVRNAEAGGAGAPRAAGPVPRPDLERLPGLFARLHDVIADGRVLACHDVSEGGVAAAVAEMAFGGDVGAALDLAPLGDARPDALLFSETAGCFLLEIAETDFRPELFEGLPGRIVGRVTEAPRITVTVGTEALFDAPVDTLRRAWLSPMAEVFGS